MKTDTFNYFGKLPCPNQEKMLELTCYVASETLEDKKFHVLKEIETNRLIKLILDPAKKHQTTQVEFYLQGILDTIEMKKALKKEVSNTQLVKLTTFVEYETPEYISINPLIIGFSIVIL